VVSPSEIQNAASGFNVAYCVISGYTAAYGRLPPMLAVLDTWGVGQGYRNANTGAWTCPEGVPTAPGMVAPTLGGSPSQLWAWAMLNPGLAVAIVGAVVYVLRPGR
jgi:hypothetical protein